MLYMALCGRLGLRIFSVDFAKAKISDAVQATYDDGLSKTKAKMFYFTSLHINGCGGIFYINYRFSV